MNAFRRLLYHPVWIRLTHWEYWSFNTVYIPIYVVWVALCIRSRSFFFFAAANPSISNGGFLNESKKDIFPLIPSEYSPLTVFFSVPANGDIVLAELQKAGLQFPLIGKPDVGGRGRGVQILTDEASVRNYVKKAFLDFHIQEFVRFKQEAGIFYYRFPNSSAGHISGIVGKEFLKVTGDGEHSIGQLIKFNKRAILQTKPLRKLLKDDWNIVLMNGIEKILVPYGNHARGAMFIDISPMADEALVRAIDQVCQRIPGFYFGRLDIRYESWDDLRQGKNFAIIEVNGAGSEPTHIYDPSHTIFFAWKEIIRHWGLLAKISRQNHRQGFKYLSLKEGIAMFREDKVWSQKLAAMDERAD